MSLCLQVPSSVLNNETKSIIHNLQDVVSFLQQLIYGDTLLITAIVVAICAANLESIY